MAWGAPQNNAQMEQQLSNLANQLYESVLDLNVPPQKVIALMDSTVLVRNKVLAWYGIEVGLGQGKGYISKPADAWGTGGGGGAWGAGGGAAAGFGGGAKGGGAKGKGKAGAPKAKKAQAAAGGSTKAAMYQDWKSALTRAMSTARGGTLPKDHIIVEHSETEGGYFAVISSVDLKTTYTGGPCKSKKEAEHDACKNAMKAEFPGEQVAPKSRMETAQPAQKASQNGALICGPGETLVEDWKSTLVRVVTKSQGATAQKDSVVVEFAEVPMMIGDSEKKGYTAVIASEKLQGSYGGGPCRSKKEAEQDACKKALQAEYPSEPVHKVKKGSAEQAAAAAAGAPLKRSAVAAGLGGGGGSADKKGRIAHMLRVLIGRPDTTEDLVYTTQQVGGMYTSTLALPAYQDDAIFQGAPCATKKEAEQSAAGVAVATLEDTVAPMEEANQVRKMSRRAEKDAAFQAKMDALKAAGTYRNMAP